MLKMTICPIRGTNTQKTWDYIKAIGDHMYAHHYECLSLTQYAIKLEQLIKNMDGIPFWRIVYLDGIIEIFSTALDQDGETPMYPFMTIEYKSAV